MRARVLVLLALVLLPLVPAGEHCACPEDGEAESCAPACDDCSCCAPAPRLLADRPGIGERRRVVAEVTEAPLLRLLSPAPRDVFHVPLAAA